jgi:hypothetical protein
VKRIRARVPIHPSGHSGTTWCRHAAMIFRALPMLACSLTVACGGVVESAQAGDAAPVYAAPTDAGISDSATDSTTGADDSGLDAGPVMFPDGGLLAHCQTGGNVLFVDGDPGEITHAGPLTFGPDAGSWSAPFAGPGGTEVDLWPTDMTWGDGWSMYFYAPVGGTLMTQRYDNTHDIFEQDAGQPTLYIMGGWKGCSMATGWFEIEQFAVDSQPNGPGTS